MDSLWHKLLRVIDLGISSPPPHTKDWDFPTVGWEVEIDAFRSRLVLFFANIIFIIIELFPIGEKYNTRLLKKMRKKW